MKNLRNVIKRELEAINRRRIILYTMTIVPLIMCFLICEIFKTGVPRDLPIAIYNADNSAISRTIVRMVNATPSCKVDYNVISLQEGKDLLVEGKSYALLVIPKHFQKDFYRGESPKIAFYYNNQLLSIGGAISKDVAVAVNTAIAGGDLKKRLKKGASVDFAMSQINLVSIDERVRSNPYLNYSYFLVLSILAQTFQALILFMAVFSVGSEFKNGTTKEWLKVAGDSIFVGVCGKLIPHFAIFSILIFISYALYYFIYGGIFVGNIFAIVLSTLMFVLSYQVIGVAFVALTSNLRLSLSIGAFYTVMAFSFAGVTYPIIAMPKIAQIYASLLPLKYYLVILIDQSIRNIPIKYDLNSFYWLIGLILIAGSVCPLLKKHAYDESKWGRS